MTFREGEEQAQPGELPEGNDDWFKPIGRRRVTLRQNLVRTIAEGISIDIPSGMEHTNWVESETFHGGIASFAGAKVDEAEEERRHMDGPDEICFWRTARE